MFNLKTGGKSYKGNDFNQLFVNAGLEIPDIDTTILTDKLRKYALKLSTNKLVLYSLEKIN